MQIFGELSQKSRWDFGENAHGLFPEQRRHEMLLHRGKGCDEIESAAASFVLPVENAAPSVPPITPQTCMDLAPAQCLDNHAHGRPLTAIDDINRVAPQMRNAGDGVPYNFAPGFGPGANA